MTDGSTNYYKKIWHGETNCWGPWRRITELRICWKEGDWKHCQDKPSACSYSHASGLKAEIRADERKGGEDTRPAEYEFQSLDLKWLTLGEDLDAMTGGGPEVKKALDSLPEGSEVKVAPGGTVYRRVSPKENREITTND